MIFTVREAREYIGRLSESSKMPCWSYSISPRSCKTGSRLAKIAGTICSKCYAFRGNYPRPVVKRCLSRREASISRPYWVDAMVVAISKNESSGYFRWHDAGDLQSLGHLIKICEVARRLPHIKFWLPTREVGILKAYLKAGFSFPNNLTIRLSATRFEELPPQSLLLELGIVGSNVSKVRWTCPSDKQNNKCLSCRKCWSKSIKVITYKYH
jgi:hypothetical protein